MSKKVSGWPLIAPRELPEGIPAYTDADADKMLIVGADETDVVPAQTVTASELGGAELSGLDDSLFVPGAAVKVTMDGITYPIVTVTKETQTTAQGDIVYYKAEFAQDASIQYYPSEEATGLVCSEGPHTIEAVVMSDAAPAWVDQPVEPKYTIPDIEPEDAGKVLTVGEGEPIWAAVPDELPAIAAGDAGKVLTVNAGETGAQWEEAQGGGNILELSAGTNTQMVSLFQSVITACATASFVTAGEYADLSNVPQEDFDAIRSCASKVANGIPCSLKVADDYYSILHCTYTPSLIQLEGVMPFYLLDHPQLGAHILRITFQMYVTGTLHAEAVCEEIFAPSEP